MKRGATCSVCGKEFEFNVPENTLEYRVPTVCNKCLWDINNPSGYSKFENDNVNHPDHYTTGGIECIDYIQDKLTPDEFRGYIKGNVLKYITREKHKNGDEDIKKAQWYLNRLVNILEG